MAFQNSTNLSIHRGSEQPPNPQQGDVWIETALNDPKVVWETWYYTVNRWHSGYYYWNFSCNETTGFNQFLTVNPVVDNNDIHIFNWAIYSLASVATSPANQWTFTLSALSQTNTASSIATLDNSDALANSWNKKGSWLTSTRSFFTDKLLRISGIPGSTVQSISFQSCLTYQLVR